MGRLVPPIRATVVFQGGGEISQGGACLCPDYTRTRTTTSCGPRIRGMVKRRAWGAMKGPGETGKRKILVFALKPVSPVVVLCCFWALVGEWLSSGLLHSLEPVF